MNQQNPNKLSKKKNQQRYKLNEELKCKQAKLKVELYNANKTKWYTKQTSLTEKELCNANKRT